MTHIHCAQSVSHELGPWTFRRGVWIRLIGRIFILVNKQNDHKRLFHIISRVSASHVLSFTTLQTEWWLFSSDADNRWESLSFISYSISLIVFAAYSQPNIMQTILIRVGGYIILYRVDLDEVTICISCWFNIQLWPVFDNINNLQVCLYYSWCNEQNNLLCGIKDMFDLHCKKEPDSAWLQI